MKLYRIDLVDPKQGHIRRFAASQKSAGEMQHAMNREYDTTQGSAEVTGVDVPTTRASIVEWLNGEFANA